MSAEQLPTHPTPNEDIELDWEEWDGSSPFLHHCLAGSIAGVSEHTLLYPMDTIKTHMQSYCAKCPHATHTSPQAQTSTYRTFTNLIQPRGGNNALLLSYSSSPSYLRLWRGVQTMAVGCVPAHALYFSTYEIIKLSSPALAGGVATICHDVIMTPLDTVKQRLQLGHYKGMTDALQTIWKYEGYRGLYRSFWITLGSNVPYGMIMVSTNEFLKEKLNPEGRFNIQASLLAGCGAGFVAAAATTPLDRLKTRLQTQNLMYVKSCDGTKCLAQEGIRYDGLKEALKTIVKEEGMRGLWRGVVPRVCTNAPAVAISWTAYESAKRYLGIMGA